MTATVLLTTGIVVFFIAALSLKIIFKKEKEFSRSCASRGEGGDSRCLCGGQGGDHCAAEKGAGTDLT